MDLNTNGAAAATAPSSFATIRHHHRKHIPSERFLPIPPPPNHHLHSSSDTELTEHDIFGISPDFSSSSIHHPTPSPTPTLPHPRSNHGILAALPGEGDSEAHSVFNHKASSASVSSPSTSSSNSVLSSPSSTSSASRLTIPKRPPPPRRTLHMSAPVNVPVLSEAMRRSRAARGLDDVIDDTDEEEDNAGEFFPPHELIAAKQTPTLSCSVMEGVGRTLKGRDLRQVRNAVWRNTGFLD